MRRCCRVATILPVLTLGLAACNNFTLFSALGEPRIGFGEPLEIGVTASANYPISSNTPAHILVRPEFANFNEAYYVRVESAGVFLAYPEDFQFTTDEGYVVNVVYDGNGNFDPQAFDVDDEDFIASYHAGSANNLSFVETRFTKVFPGEYAPVTFVVPSVPLDGNEPANDDPVFTPQTLTLNMPLTASTIHATVDIDYFYFTSVGGAHTVTVSQSSGRDPMTTFMAVCFNPPGTMCDEQFEFDVTNVNVAAGLTTKSGTMPAGDYAIGIVRDEGSAFGYYDIVITSP